MSGVSAILRIACVATALIVLAVAPLRAAGDDDDLVSVEAAALGFELDELGHVVIPGLFFETGKATLTPESDAALAVIAAILSSRPRVKIWVVGHTDWTGALELNMTMSDARAKAVVAALVDSHGIEAGRLAGYGVGPLAPEATNDDEEGRAANRRIELVVRPD